MSESRLTRVKVVLYEPQDPVNIAAVIRAMKNMGVHSLRLVRPVAYDPHRIAGVAHDTEDIIAAIEHFESLEEALADCVRVAGFTARRRAAKREVLTARYRPLKTWCDLQKAETWPCCLGGRIRGSRTKRSTSLILSSPCPQRRHASLNLAQAVLIGLYELHLCSADATRAVGRIRGKQPTRRQAKHFELLFGDAHRALTEIGLLQDAER